MTFSYLVDVKRWINKTRKHSSPRAIHNLCLIGWLRATALLTALLPSVVRNAKRQLTESKDVATRRQVSNPAEPLVSPWLVVWPTCHPVVGRMLVHVIHPFSKLAVVHMDRSKRLVYNSLPWFFCPLGTDFTIFLVNECAVVTGEDRWALNWFIITQSKAGPLYDFRKVLASLRLDYILIQEVRKKKIWILEASPSLCSK